jgi:hypothetical protein
MKTRTIGLAACALLLSACTSAGVRYGMVERDGDWYSPAADGRGDYYTSMFDERVRDWPWDMRVGIAPFSGYCPVRYRYCTSMFADPFYGPWWTSWYYSPFHGPYYDPFWYQPWVYYPPKPRRLHADFDGPPPVGPGFHGGHGPGQPATAPAARPRPRPWQERRAPRSGSLGGSGHPKPSLPVLGDGH